MWKIVITDNFSQQFKKISRNRDFVEALDKKIERLKLDPYSVGGGLRKELSGKRSTRLLKNYRVVFEISEKDKSVYLLAVDHRKFDYRRF
jgi:mRNA-degrading endonuclease RelE of RelBE toxin-antitoxin system